MIFLVFIYIMHLNDVGSFKRIKSVAANDFLSTPL